MGAAKRTRAQVCNSPEPESRKMPKVTNDLEKKFEDTEVPGGSDAKENGKHESSGDETAMVFDDVVRYVFKSASTSNVFLIFGTRLNPYLCVTLQSLYVCLLIVNSAQVV